MTVEPGGTTIVFCGGGGGLLLEMQPMRSAGTVRARIMRITGNVLRSFDPDLALSTRFAVREFRDRHGAAGCGIMSKGMGGDAI